MDKLDNFSKVRVLVIGDVMIDRYLIGDVERISPEAPVPVVKLKKTSLIAGGAANVAANVAGLGAYPYLIGLVGNDDEGKIFPDVLNAANVSGDYLIKVNDRQTTIKTRILAHNQQIARIDQETTDELSAAVETEIWDKVRSLLNEVSVVIVSDYNKGFLSKRFLMRLIKYCKNRGHIILADPKGKDYTKYKGVTIITPNKSEVAEVCGLSGVSDNLLDKAGQELLVKLKLEALLITRGENGMTLFEKGRNPLHLNALARHVYDVTGAGDTVIATLAVAVGAGENFAAAAEIANTAAGLVVEEIGTTTISIQRLRHDIQP